MCGIVGIINSKLVNNHEVISRMQSALIHRGPDQCNSVFFDNLGLGHLRLSIVDLESGNQPMKSLLSQKYIVFNGEIYGYKEIKEKLTEFVFSTNSDTEVILALYEKYGDDCLEYLPGMFAFAIWDEDNQSLFAARDRFGEKPFYYSLLDDGTLIFASELKAILASKLITPQIDYESVAHYLKFLYIQPDKTIYRNIHVLPPGYSLKYEAGYLKLKKYWKLPIQEFKGSYEDAKDQFKNLLELSVKNQLVADVPVGAFLSGGIDSSTIVAIASGYKSNIETFSFGFNNSLDELPYAKQIATKYDTKHTEIIEDDIDLGQLFIKMIEIYDEPFADSSNIPTYLITKKASNLKVVLTGDGADELLGGYDFWYNQVCEIVNNKRKSPFKYWLKNGFQNKGVFNFYKNKAGAFNDIEICKILKKEIHTYYRASLSIDRDDLNTALNMDLINYMPGDILVKTDRASMSNSLELRAPFLDVEFAKFCISLPPEYKIYDFNTKHILKDTFGDKLTPDILNRRKQGFGSPVAKWLSTSSLTHLKELYLNNPECKIFKNLLSFSDTRQFVKLNNYQTWSLLVLSIWCERNDFEN